MGNAGGSGEKAHSKSSWKRGRGKHGHVGLTLSDFRCPRGFMSNIGVGGFGRVLAMEKKDEPNRRFAVKCLNKSKVVARNQVENCMNELNILRRMDHYPYLVNLFYAFQDKNYLYMCTDLMLGGTLQRAMKKCPLGHFGDQPQKICQFAAELTLALQFLHSQNVVHRDIKPDNILLDAKGHCHLTDFNVSIYVEPGNEEIQKHEDGWGTRGYRAPEVYLRTGKGFIFACDWWSLGAVIYELYCGEVPYPKKANEESSTDLLIRMNAESADFSVIRDDIAVDFVAKLLRFEPEFRIGCQHGCNSEVMIMTHPFFDGMDWDDLEKYSNHNDMDIRSNTGNSSEVSMPGTGTHDDSESGTTLSQGASMRDFADNFDSSLDQREKLRILQRNMGILGLSGAPGGIEDEDDEDFPRLKESQQVQFKDWAFNVDFKLEQQKMPQYTLLQTVSSMAPDQIKNWILHNSQQSLRALCSEIKAYREQAMKENFDHVMAEMRIEQLQEENLRLVRQVAELRAEQKSSSTTHKIPSPRSAPPLQQRDSVVQEESKEVKKANLLLPEPVKLRYIPDISSSRFSTNGAPSDEEEVVLFSPVDMDRKGRAHDGFHVEDGDDRFPDDTPPQSPGVVVGSPLNMEKYMSSAKGRSQGRGGEGEQPA